MIWPPPWCPIHETDLLEGTASIAYGLIMLPEGYFEARDRLFPLANATFMGGCIVSDDSPREETVKYCPDCRHAEELWIREHPR